MIKMMNLDNHLRFLLENELKCFKKLDKHINIVNIIEIIETKTTKFIVTEYLKNGDLFDYIMNLKQKREKLQGTI